jgi:two-component system response regulator
MEGFGPRPHGAPRTVLLVEDDPGDTLMIREALEAYAPDTEIAAVVDGVDALRYLRREGEFAGTPRPDLVLLDLNMPRKDGREVLAEVKSDRELCSIPVVVLTTSSAAQDIRHSYQLHANAYVTKPSDFDEFTSVVRCIERFFGRVVQLPRMA